MGATTIKLQQAAENAQSAYKLKKAEVKNLFDEAEKLFPNLREQSLKYMTLLEAVENLEKQQEKDPYNKEVILKRDTARKIAETQRLVKEAAVRLYMAAKNKAEEGEKEFNGLRQKRNETRKALDDFLENKGKTNKTFHSLKMKAKRFFNSK